MNKPEMLDGYPIDRREILDITNKEKVEAFIRKLRLGRVKITDVRVVQPKETKGEDQEIKERLRRIMQYANPTRKSMKQMRKAERPRWRR